MDFKINDDNSITYQINISELPKSLREKTDTAVEKYLHRTDDHVFIELKKHDDSTMSFQKLNDLGAVGKAADDKNCQSLLVFVNNSENRSLIDKSFDLKADIDTQKERYVDSIKATKGLRNDTLISESDFMKKLDIEKIPFQKISEQKYDEMITKLDSMPMNKIDKDGFIKSELPKYMQLTENSLSDLQFDFDRLRSDGVITDGKTFLKHYDLSDIENTSVKTVNSADTSEYFKIFDKSAMVGHHHHHVMQVIDSKLEMIDEKYKLSDHNLVSDFEFDENNNPYVDLVYKDNTFGSQTSAIWQSDKTTENFSQLSTEEKISFMVERREQAYADLYKDMNFTVVKQSDYDALYNRMMSPVTRDKVTEMRGLDGSDLKISYSKTERGLVDQNGKSVVAENSDIHKKFAISHYIERGHKIENYPAKGESVSDFTQMMKEYADPPRSQKQSQTENDNKSSHQKIA